MWKTLITGSVVNIWSVMMGDLMMKLPNPHLIYQNQLCKMHKKNPHKQIKFLEPLFFKPITVIFKHFSRKIVNFQGRLKIQALFKTVVKFKHFSRSVGTIWSGIPFMSYGFFKIWPWKSITMAGLWRVIWVCITHFYMVQCTHLTTTGGAPHLYNRGSSMQVNSLHSEANDM